MVSRKAKKLAPAREQLQALTPAELTEVSGGGDSHHGHRPRGGGGGYGYGHHWHHHRWHHHGHWWSGKN